ncbi:TetR/AcrR family transcriptional regulator [Rhodococcus sp. F64268]|uniref:TetR/AcrR family transcriptional regulator n=1 Tax=Rhodococcus sp. F64268 TaxID=2926402 RepID=UPI001FF44698|nr:TetR/AcrR family transcriptional regulator [Rhodococcus sp. F64268]MCK0090334.1 TetR/AcrR family transcriptional regulator [Rhodococcus sp. F64268]
MSVQERKARERASRHRSIIAAAREMAEAEGWDAVTTRRLAERIEYSQPVLYSHFRGKDEIIAAVALDGFSEMTVELSRAVSGTRSSRAAVAALTRAYIAFGERHPAVYDSMFNLDNGLPFADPATPAPMRESFQVLHDTLALVAGDVEPGLLAEVYWAAVHGLVELTRTGRVPPQDTAHRIEVLVDRFADE